METKYFKKVEKDGHVHFVSRQGLYTGIRILLFGEARAMLDNLYCVHSDDYVEISEEEFTEAFEKAISIISKNMLVAA